MKVSTGEVKNKIIADNMANNKKFVHTWKLLNSLSSNDGSSDNATFAMQTPIGCLVRSVTIHANGASSESMALLHGVTLKTKDGVSRLI